MLYPSSISVSTLAGLVDKATIFSKLTHSFTADVDAMVSGPGGGKVNSITSQPVNPVPFMLLSPTVNTNGRPQFVLLGTIRDICEIHSSSNLMQWTAVSTNTLTSTTLLWLDTNAAPPWEQRFYRARRRR